MEGRMNNTSEKNSRVHMKESDPQQTESPEQVSRQGLIRNLDNYRLLINSIKDYGIFMLDTQGYVMSWNLGAECIKGYKAEEIIGSHFSIFYLKEDIQAGKPQMEL